MTRDEILSIAKPILFNTEMVKAILEEHKGVTRRPIEPQPKYPIIQSRIEGFWEERVPCANGVRIMYPRYQIGDFLYVRETWAINNITPHDPEWLYKADYDCSIYPYSNWKWKPSIHMPKEAARLILQVKNVYTEQVQDITHEQAILEGFASRTDFIKSFLKMYPEYTKESWNWVYEFERLEVNDNNR